MRAKLGWMLQAPAMVSAAAGSSASAQDVTAISEIRQESTERSTRLVVQCTGPLAYTYYSPDPLTLVVDVPEVDASRLPSRINVGTREVESVRVTSMARADGRNLARLEVRLASLVPYQIYSKEKSLFLIFERQADSGAAAPASAKAAPAPLAVSPATPVASGEAPAGVEPPSEPVAEAQPAKPAKPAKPESRAETRLAANAPRATRISSIEQRTEGGQLAVIVKADGTLRHQDFFLGNPDRLVIDFNDVISRATLRSLDVNDGPVRKVRLAQFSTGTPKVARLVLDLKNRAPYHIVDAEDGVRIVFGEGQTPSPAPLAALRTDPDPVPEPVVAPVPVAPTILPTARDPEPVVQQAPRPESFAPSTVGSTQKQYTGHPISLDFKDGDLQDIFRLFADISGLNVVVNPGVSGKVTLKLVEVPWDQALDLILKTNGLGYTLEENVIRIAPLASLQKEESERRKLQEEKALAGDLHVVSKRLSYAKGGELEATIKKVALSARGTITLDTRTNTMIITDLSANLEKAKDLIAELDRATLQVEIEARIVVTSRNFTRDLGIQWGFNQQRTSQFGNTTNQTFPNSYIINGQGVPSTGGLAPKGTDAGIGSTGRGYFVNLPAAGFNTALGITMGNILGNFNIDAALTALERQGRGRLLSTPKVTTQNNLPATIKQGTQIPIQTVANNTVTVSFKDAVLTLAVTPQITEAGTVILKVTVDNNSADFANEVNGIPPINTQSAKTIVLVRDGATSVIGGIYQSNEQTAQQLTPVLGRLPLLGYLFRNRFVTNTNNELLIFITPRIIRS